MSASNKIQTAEEAGAWLESLINVERRPDWPYRRLSLAPIRDLLERLGDPHRGLSVLHVAGSKGKGSTVRLAESVLRAAGATTATFTSPHLESWIERFCIDGEPVSGERLAGAVERVRQQVEALHRGDVDEAPTFFDATTAAAFLLFREAGVDHVVLEVGLGGRLDSTNACEPSVTVVTSIELEHTDRLGTTLGAIAAEKAGILKAGVPAVVGALPEEALRVVRDRAESVGAPFVHLGEHFHVEAVDRGIEGSLVRIIDGALEVECLLPMPGGAAPSNAALAVAAVRRLLGEDEPGLEGAVRRGLGSARVPGVLERVEEEPIVIIDAAHTAASARTLAGVLGGLGRPVDLVLSVSADKDLEKLLEALLPVSRMVTLTRADAIRSLDPREIARVVRHRAPDTDLRVVPNAHLAVRAAREAVSPGEALCVAGSVYLAGIARRVLRDPESNRRVAVTREGRS